MVGIISYRYGKYTDISSCWAQIIVPIPHAALRGARTKQGEVVAVGEGQKPLVINSSTILRAESCNDVTGQELSSDFSVPYKTSW